MSDCICFVNSKAYHSFALLDIDLVTNDNLSQSVSGYLHHVWTTYKWEALWIHWASLDQELVAPAV